MYNVYQFTYTEMGSCGFLQPEQHWIWLTSKMVEGDYHELILQRYLESSFDILVVAEINYLDNDVCVFYVLIVARFGLFLDK